MARQLSTGPSQVGRTTPTPATSPQDSNASTPASGAGNHGALALIVVSAAWGYSWVANKVALGYCTPLTFAALRGLLSASCLFLVLALTRRPLRPPPIGYTLAIGLLQTTAFLGLMAWALASGGAGKVAVLTYTMPFWLLLLARVFLNERLRGTQWLAVGLSLAGLLLVLAPWQLHGVLSSTLALVTGVAWAASAVVVKRMQRRRQVDVLSLTSWQMLLGSLPLIVIAILAHSSGPHWTLPFVGAMAYSVVPAYALSWVLWAYALRVLPAGVAGLGTMAIPVLGVVAAWLQLGEQPDRVEAVGMTFIIGALAVLAVRGVISSRRLAAMDGSSASRLQD
jgi:drug/metabolite transporter (DMT)-like permease